MFTYSKILRSGQDILGKTPTAFCFASKMLWDTISAPWQHAEGFFLPLFLFFLEVTLLLVSGKKDKRCYCALRNAK